MGPKKRRGSPSKSEPGGTKSNNSLLRSALAKSRSEKRTSSRTGSIADITNTQFRSNMSTLSTSSLDGTAKKRGKALVAFKQFQETVTPRTAMMEFMEVHQSSMQTPAMFFNRQATQSSSDSAMGSYVQSRGAGTIHADSLISDMSGSVSGQADQDTTTMSSDVSLDNVRTRKRKKAKGGVTLEDVDPDRDITRPTNMSRNNTGQENMSSYPLSDESANETMEVQVRKGRRRRKTEYRVEDFDFSIAIPGSQKEVEASNTHSHTGLGRTMVDSVYQVDRSLDITDEVAEKLRGRRDKMVRRQTRHQQQVDVGDFSGLETPIQKSVEKVDSDVEEEGDKTLVGNDDVVEKLEEVPDPVYSKHIDETATKLGSTLGMTLGDFGDEEETPIVVKRKRVRRGDYNEVVGKQFNFTEIETPALSVISDIEAVISGIEADISPSDPRPAVTVTSTTLLPDHTTADTSLDTPVRKVRQRKGKDVNADHFTGISVVDSSSPDVVSASFQSSSSMAKQEDVIEESKLANETGEAATGQTITMLADNDSPEETPARVTRAERRKMEIGAAEFSDLSLHVDEKELVEDRNDNSQLIVNQIQALESQTLMNTNTTMLDNHNTMGQTMLGFTVNEDTPVRTTRAGKRKVDVNAAEFTDLSILDYAGETSISPVIDTDAGNTAAAILQCSASIMEKPLSASKSSVINKSQMQSKITVDKSKEEQEASSETAQTANTLEHAGLGRNTADSSFPDKQENEDYQTHASKGEYEFSKSEELLNITISKAPTHTNVQEVSPGTIDKSIILDHAGRGTTTLVNSSPVTRRPSSMSSTPPLTFSPLVNTPSPSSRSLTNRKARNEEQVQVSPKKFAGVDNVIKESSHLTGDPIIDVSDHHTSNDVCVATPPIEQAETAGDEVDKQDSLRKQSYTREDTLSRSKEPIHTISQAGVSADDSTLVSDNTSLGSISLHTTLPVKRGRVKPAVGVDMDEFDISLPIKLAEPAREGEDDDDEDETQPLSQEEKEVLFSETKARRAARKSEVLGHLVRAPNLSNIVEASEGTSRPNSGMGSRRSSSDVGSTLGKDMSNKRSSSTEVKSARSSIGLITSIVEGKEDAGNEHSRNFDSEQMVGTLKHSHPTEDDITNQETAAIEVVPAFKSRRKSLYQGGLPDDPLDSSMVCDQTRVFRPEVESTRLGNMTGLTDMSPVQEVSSRQGARPGRDTSTPDITKARGKERHVQANTASPSGSPQTRSFLPSVPSKLTLPQPTHHLSQTQPAHQPITSSKQPVVRLSKTLANKSLMSITSGTQYETPEQVREARRSSRRSNLKTSLYNTRLELDDIVEGGTQTTPTLELTSAKPQPVLPLAWPQLSETVGCQVTPGLAEPLLCQTGVTVYQDRTETPRTHKGEMDNMVSHIQDKSITVSTSTSPSITTHQDLSQHSVSEQWLERRTTASCQPLERIVYLTDSQVRSKRVDHAKVRVEINQLNDKIEEAIRKEKYMMAEKIKEKVSNLKERQEKLEVEIETRNVIDELDQDTSKTVVGIEDVTKHIVPSDGDALQLIDDENIDTTVDNEVVPKMTKVCNEVKDTLEENSSDVDNDIGDIVKNISDNFNEDEDSRDRFDENRENDEWAFPQHNLSKSKDLINSVLEEVDIDEVNDLDTSDNDENVDELNITGRKNPSPVLVRRPEIDVESDEDIKSNHNQDKNDHYEDAADPDNGQDDSPNKSELNLPALPLPHHSLPQFSPNTSGPVLVSERVVPSNKERKEMRQATLARYLGIQDCTGREGLDTLLTPQPPQQKKAAAPPARQKATKPVPKTVFPAKNIKFEYNRFSRFKVKKDAEEILTEASQDFMEMAMSRLTDLATERGAEKIHLCDIRKLMGECGFVVPVENDPANRQLNSTLRDLVREDMVRELIPCSMGGGKVYPPVDCWKEKGGKKKTVKGGSKPVASGSRASVGKGSAGKKADKVKRFKVVDDLDTTEPKRPRIEVGKNGGKGRKNKN